MKETIAILLLMSCLGLGAVIFYVFLQFLNSSRQAEERQRQILERLAQLEKRLETKAPDGPRPPAPNP